MTVQFNGPDFSRQAAEHDQYHVNNFYSHQVYLTEHDGNPHLEALWAALTRKPEDRVIGVTVTGGMGSIAISATSAEMGDNVNDIQALVEGKKLEISFNAKYLIEYLSTVDQPQVQIETTESTRPGAFTIPGIPTDDHIHVCMPMHPPR